MTQILDALLYGSGAALFVWLGFSSFVSWREGEPRAAGRLLLLTLLLPFPYLAVVLLPGSSGTTTGIVILALTLAAAAIVLVPTARAPGGAGHADDTVRRAGRDVLSRPPRSRLEAIHRVLRAKSGELRAG